VVDSTCTDQSIAGVQLDQEVLAGNMTTREMWAKNWNINVISTHVVTQSFVPLLLKSKAPRLLFITSGTSTLTDHGDQSLAVNQSPKAGWPKQAFSVTSYRAAKTGLNMAMCEWARLLKNDGVKVWSVSPGFLATGLGVGEEKMKEMGAVDPSVGGKLVRDVVEGAHDEKVGKVVHASGVQPW
jgi:NAD(P)-dependent dehydrogenase (short-subunit alcohol dehydrogenase family)